MADVSVTDTLVRPMPGAVVQRLIAHEHVHCGQIVYINSDGEGQLCDADAAASSIVFGIVVSAPYGRATAEAGEAIDVVVFGGVTGFASLTPGALLYASTTAGAIADARPAGSSGDYVYIVGLALTAAIVFVKTFTDSFAAA